MKRGASVISLVLCVMALLISACGENGSGGESVSKDSSNASVTAALDVEMDGAHLGASDTEMGTRDIEEGNESYDEGGKIADASFDGYGEDGGVPDGADGEYNLEYKLSYGYRDEAEGRYIYHLDGQVTVDGEERITDAEWYNKNRPFVYAMFFPDLFGERVCQLYMDFALYEYDNEIFINLPYDSPNGTFDNDAALQYDDMGAIDNGGSIRINFPVTISGVGTDTLTITDGIDDFTYVFTLQK